MGEVSYKGHRYPAEIIAHCVWLYHRFPLSFREVEELMLRSYAVAHREVMLSVEHRQSRYLNNRAENSHQPTRHRERAMKRFRTPGAAQRFLAVFSVISPHFRPRRHRLTADDYRTEMTRRCWTLRAVASRAPMPRVPE